jgi:RimJ/RimL family protein N-acetyltransferase
MARPVRSVDKQERIGASAGGIRLQFPETIQPLDEDDRPAVVAHFIALPADDRRLRFGATLADAAVVEYVDRIDVERDTLLGLREQGNPLLIGVAHVAFGDADAELGISVLPEYRGRGAGTALFCRAVKHARERGVSRVFMHCLAENAAMMHIARRSGMKIVVAWGDADAHLALSPGVSAPTRQEALAEAIALYDAALKASVARVRRRWPSAQPAEEII